MKINADDFENYDEIIICSNYIKDYKSIIKQNDNGFEPLIIKKDSERRPLIFLKSYIDNKSETIDIINGEKSLINSFTFESSTTGCIITHKNVAILEAVLNEKGIMEVITLDLRPIGLNIFGDSTALNIGGNRISRSSMSGVGTLIGI